MAKLTFILNKQRPTKEGRYPVALRIVKGNSNTTVSCDVTIPESAFVGDSEKVIASKWANSKQLNADLQELYYSYINAIHELKRSGKINSMSAVDIKNYVEQKKEYHTEQTFTGVMQDCMKNSRTQKTKDTFGYTIQKLTQFCGKQKLFFEEINYKFLTDFERWMEQNGMSISSRGIVFRNIRSVYNYAINNDWVNASLYPFRKFKIKQSHKEKVYLPEDKMRELLALDLSGDKQTGLAFARDFFMLSFFFCGINPIDLYNLPPFHEGRISFVRTKVQFHEPQPIHIGIQPEAQEIINKYAGEKHLLNFAEHYLSFANCYHYLKHRLKKLGDMIGCPGITFYWARYSWATYASKIDVSDSTISKALGHSSTTLAEKRYISFDWSKVDKANRRVIDYVLYGKE